MKITNWKTTAAGIGALLLIVGKLLQGGSLEERDFGAVIAAVGLIAARDHDNHAGA